jgi:acyl-CoA synthetase (AMP-forming)/AMP-acid ligase II
MLISPSSNFAARLIEKLGANSTLVEASSKRTFSAAEIVGLIAGFAKRFVSAGLQPGDRILVNCGVNPESALAYLGAMYAGIVPVLLDERTHTASGDVVFEKAQAKAAWSSKPLPWERMQKNGFPQFEGLCEPCSPTSVPSFASGAEELAALMPTSGSTGVPRLVMVSHANLIANTEAVIRSQHLGADEKAMLIMPVSYCFGASVLHTHLYQGGGVVFDSRFMFPDKVLQAIDKHGCTTFAGVPTVYNILLRRSNIRTMPMSSLRRFLQAGGALAPESIEDLRTIVPNAKLFVMYGQTEATARISCLPSEFLKEKLGSAGLPLDNIKVRIVNEDGEELKVADTGEIQISGPSICSGYLDEPEATRNKFSQGWLKTGDLGYRDKDGYLWIKGRNTDFLKIRGYRVGLAEVEARVAAVSGIAECAATAVQHPEAGEAIALFLVRAEGETSTSSSLVARVRQTLPSQWTCDSIKIVPDLPRTANGKIARSQLQTLA